MKKLYVFSLLFALSYVSQAQIVMFSDTSNKWSVTGFDNTSSRPYTRDISYTGNRVVDGKSYQVLQEGSSHSQFLIRETDWGWGKVYARTVSGTDTLEHLLYDYTLNVNDTFRTEFNGKQSVAIVTARNITYFVGYEYLTWNLRFVSGGGFPLEYVVIQGIGALTDPMYPLLASNYGGDVSAVSCFTHNNAQPLVAPSVPYDAITSTLLKARFDNDSSCMYNSLAVPNLADNNIQTVQLLPNPLNSNTKFVFTPAIQIGAVVITNSVGQTVINKTVQDEKEFLIGNQIANPGIYFYRVSDYRTGRTFAGEFIY